MRLYNKKAIGSIEFIGAKRYSKNRKLIALVDAKGFSRLLEDKKKSTERGGR